MAIRQSREQRPSRKTRRSSITQKRKKAQRKKKRSGCLKVFLFIVILAVLFVVLGITMNSCSKNVSQTFSLYGLSDDVLSYETLVHDTAVENGIGEYTDILLCIMMQESKGRGNDPMQSSECIYNTIYPKQVNGIQDPQYSIECGCRYFVDCLDEAGCTGIEDTNALMMAIQGYNYGHGYITWALERDGGYTEENAQAFSEKMRDQLGWTVYGDPVYVEKVMRYYAHLTEQDE